MALLAALAMLAACSSSPTEDAPDIGGVSCADWAGAHVQMSAEATPKERQWILQDATKAGMRVTEKPDLDYSGGTVSSGTIITFVNTRCWEHPNWKVSDAARAAYLAINEWIAATAR